MGYENPRADKNKNKIEKRGYNDESQKATLRPSWDGRDSGKPSMHHYKAHECFISMRPIHRQTET